MNQTELNVKIVGYDRRYDRDFARLNYEWLHTYFEVEDHDRLMLDQPFNHIIQRGGWILFAQLDSQIVGSVALIYVNDETYELSKMAVTPKYQGFKIGNKLMDAAIDYTRNKGIRFLILESNTKLLPAINLYKKVGFEEIIPDPNTPYTRCNIRMRLTL